MKAGPLSDCMEVGRLNLGMMLCSKASVTQVAPSETIGNASTQAVKVSMNTRRYLNFLMKGRCVKLICQFCPGIWPLAWWNAYGEVLPTPWGQVR